LAPFNPTTKFCFSLDAVWELVLELGGGGLLDAVGNGRLAGGVGDTLTSLVLLGGAGHVYLFCVVVVVKRID